jgi:hypothetical protein
MLHFVFIRKLTQRMLHLIKSLSFKEVVCMCIVSALSYTYFTVSAQQRSQLRNEKIAEFYATIANQEHIRNDTNVTAHDSEALTQCDTHKNSDECMRTFYDAYTMAHGGERAFAHLAALQKVRPDLLPRCHYISHGIGHAMLRLHNQNVFEAFNVLQSGTYFKNIATCGNGYFHGVIEEVAGSVTGVDALVATLTPICADKRIENRGGCYHGVGHASLIQTNYSVQDMISVCEAISSNPTHVFSCLTGGFMEYDSVYTDAVKVENKQMQFTLCDSLEKKYRPACYLEQSSGFERYLNDRRNYTRTMDYCKQIADPLNRMACVKLFSIRAVRITRYADIQGMCANTSTLPEQVMCTAITADRVGASIDISRSSPTYRTAIHTICAALNPYLALQCRTLVDEKSPSRLFYTSERDLRLSTPLELLVSSTGV